VNIQKKNKSNNILRKNLVLASLVIAIAVLPLLFLKDAEFGGADGAAKDEISKIDGNYKPWFSSIWSPPSSEVESLLFSLQAAIGSGVVCYFFGYSKGKSHSNEGKND
jgi:cobalt/nickel transport protein